MKITKKITLNEKEADLILIAIDDEMESLREEIYLEKSPSAKKEYEAEFEKYEQIYTKLNNIFATFPK